MHSENSPLTALSTVVVPNIEELSKYLLIELIE